MSIPRVADREPQLIVNALLKCFVLGVEGLGSEVGAEMALGQRNRRTGFQIGIRLKAFVGFRVVGRGQLRLLEEREPRTQITLTLRASL